METTGIVNDIVDEIVTCGRVFILVYKFVLNIYDVVIFGS